MFEHAGKCLRAKKIFREDGRTLIAAMDHSRGGHVRGLEDYRGVIEKMSQGGADAILASYGNIVRHCRAIPRGVGVIFSLAPPQDASQVRIAARLGAVGIKFTHFGSIRDERLKVLQPLASECEEYGLVFLAEVVPQDTERKTVSDQVGSAIRLATEAGADFVKTAYTGSVESFTAALEHSNVPVVILGGPKMGTERDVLETVRDSLVAGGAGVAFGRNLFQHKNPAAMTQAISSIIHAGASVDKALTTINSVDDV